MKLLCVLLGAMGLIGCVQQTTYSGTDQRVVETKINHEAAARDRLSLGLAYLRRGNTEQAKFNFERALQYTPNSAEALLAMAHYFDTVKHPEQAESYYRQAVAIVPLSADAANNFGAYLCRHGHYEESEQWMLKAVISKGYIRASQTYENLGLCAQEAGWTEKAAAYYEQALNYNPRRASSLLQVAELKFAAQQLPAARSYLGRYHSNGNESAASLWLAAQVEFAANNTDEARRFGVLLLAKFPTSAQAQAYRTKYY